MLNFLKKYLKYSAISWYYKAVREVFVMDKKVISENNYYCDALNLAYYVADRYYGKYKEEISSLKLQKSLYFLFAYWGGFVEKGNGKKTELKNAYKPYLFYNRIEAWTYGPVVPEVYKETEHIKLISSNIPSGVELCKDIKQFVNGLCDEMFEVSDFKLVDLSHSDNCWKKSFVEEDERHNREILKEDIIDEYSKRKFV